ncbi:hypothetical protein [Geodermatophilus sp. URMC 63]
MTSSADVAGPEVPGPTGGRYGEVPAPDALEPVALLHREPGGHRPEPVTEPAPADDRPGSPVLPAHERMP